MKRVISWTFSWALLVIWANGSIMADGSPEATPVAPSIQKQIEELKAGQERLLKEVAEIKALLQQKAQRADYPTRPTRPSVVTLGVQGENFRGSSQAKIAVMEYSDFDCSFCAKYVRELYPKLEADYVKTGKIKYYFRDLPAPEHTNSLFKAQLARCASEQGKFWEMHDLLFADPSPLTAQGLEPIAQTLGLDLGHLKDCLAAGRYTEAIARSAAGARRMGVDGTPAFLIGTVSRDGDTVTATKFVIGGEDYDALKTAIDELLSGGQKR